MVELGGILIIILQSDDYFFVESVLAESNLYNSLKNEIKINIFYEKSDNQPRNL